MKYLKTFENYSIEDIQRALKSSEEKGEISGDINKVLNRFKKHDIGSFEAFVDNEANFISEFSKQRMSEFIKRFKQLGLDTSKLESLFDKYDRHNKITFEYDDIHMDDLSDDEKDAEYEKLDKEADKLIPFVKEFETEVKRIAKEAKKII